MTNISIKQTTPHISIRASGKEGPPGPNGDPGTTDYNLLENLPSLGTAAAANTTDFATAAQGAKADTAVQPAAIANFETTTQLNTRDTDNRDRANHTGEQAISTVTGLQGALDGKAGATHVHGVSDITATGTPSDSTYLRGDGVWAAVASGGSFGAAGSVWTDSDGHDHRVFMGTNGQFQTWRIGEPIGLLLTLTKS